MKLQNIVRHILGIIFLLSAILKLIDFNATAELFTNLLGLEITIAKLLLCTLILIEIVISYLLFANHIKNNLIIFFVSGMIVAFIIVNLFFFVKGNNNCGCFGNSVESSPLVSIVKNLLMLFGVYYLRYNVRQKDLINIKK